MSCIWNQLSESFRHLLKFSLLQFHPISRTPFHHSFCWLPSRLFTPSIPGRRTNFSTACRIFLCSPALLKFFSLINNRQCGHPIITANSLGLFFLFSFFLIFFPPKTVPTIHHWKQGRAAWSQFAFQHSCQKADLNLKKTEPCRLGVESTLTFGDTRQEYFARIYQNAEVSLSIKLTIELVYRWIFSLRR